MPIVCWKTRLPNQKLEHFDYISVKEYFGSTRVVFHKTRCVPSFLFFLWNTVGLMYLICICLSVGIVVQRSNILMLLQDAWEWFWLYVLFRVLQNLQFIGNDGLLLINIQNMNKGFNKEFVRKYLKLQSRIGLICNYIASLICKQYAPNQILFTRHWGSNSTELCKALDNGKHEFV